MEARFDKVEKMMDSRKDIIWKYNKEERRQRTYKEMFDRRDINLSENMKFPYFTMTLEEKEAYIRRKLDTNAEERDDKTASNVTDEQMLEMIKSMGISSDQSGFDEEEEEYEDIEEGEDEDN